ncbi:MAG: MazG nucleotide pyrophosphohydrolase domain-containing protein [Candidatus Woesearchaeota archaeon]
MEESFKRLNELCRKLRRECPWDSRQTIESYFRYVLDEAEEFNEAAEKGDHEGMKEELGDVMWNLLMISRMAEEKGMFSIRDAMESAHEKMVRRHPHVFNGESDNVEDIERRWKEIKREEKNRKTFK